MKPMLKLACIATGAGALVACSTPPQLLQSKVVPVYSTGGVKVSADTYVVVARRYEMQRRFAEAEAAYRSALAQDAAHVDALQGLALLRAQRRDYPAAAELLERAAKAAPQNAAIANNLGYARFLEGKYRQAADELARATRLAPDDARAWNNYGTVLRKLGRKDEAEQAEARVAELHHPEPRPPLTVRPLHAVAAPADAPAAAPQHAGPPLSAVPFRTVITPAGSGVVEVRFQQRQAPATATASLPAVPAAGTAANAAPKPPVQTLQPLQPARPLQAPEVTEIRNGNGITGLARRFGQALTPYGFRVVRLTNAPGFSEAGTRIEYRHGHEQAARALQRMLPQSSVVAAAGPGPDLLLVLGHDVSSVAELETGAGNAVAEAGASPASADSAASPPPRQPA